MSADLDHLLPQDKPRHTKWDTLTREHQAWVSLKFNDGVPATHVATALRKAGYKVSNTTVKEWHRG